MADEVIDRAYVEIVPELRDFSRTVTTEIDRGLREVTTAIRGSTERFDRELNRQIADGVDPSVVDQLAAGVRDANRKIAQSELDVREAELNLTATRERLTVVTNDATASDQDKARAAVAVERAELRQAAAVDQLTSARGKATAASTRLQDALRGETRAARDAGDAHDTLRRNVDRGVDVRQLQTLAQKLRDLRTLYQSIIVPIRNFSTQLAKVAVVAGAGSAASLAATGLTAQVLALVGSLGQVVAIAPVATTALIGLVGTFATVKLAGVGVSDALSQIVKVNQQVAVGAKLSKADMAKLNDALKGLAPNARAFALQFNAIYPALRKVQQGVQQLAFARLAGDLRALADRYLPSLRSAAFNLAATLNDAVDGAIRNLLNSTTQWNLRAVLKDAQVAAEQFTPVLARIPAVLIDVAAAAGPAFRGLAQDLARVLASVLDRLEGSVRSGALADALDDAVVTLKALGGIAANVFGTVRALVDAASHAVGGDLVVALKGATDGLSDFLKSAQGQEVLRAVFTTGIEVLRDLGTLLRQVTPLLVKLAPVVRQLANAFLQGLGPVLPIVAELAVTIGQTLVGVLPSISKLAVALGNTLSGAIETLAPIIPPLAEALATLLSPTGALSALLDAIAPILLPLAQGLAQVVSILGGGLVVAFDQLAPVLPDLVTALTQLAVVLSQALVQSLTTLLPFLPPMIESLTTLIVVVTPLISLVAKLAQPLIFLAGVATLLISPIFLLGQAFAFVGNVISSIKGPVTVAIQLIIGAVVRFAANVGAAVSTAIAFFQSLPGRVGAALASLPGVLQRAAVGAARSFANAITTGFRGVVQFFREIPGRITSAIGDLSGVLLNAGKAVMRGLIEGIKRGISELGNVLGSVGSFIASHKGPLDYDRRLLIPHGQALMAGLIDGITVGRARLADALAGVTGQVGALAAPGVGAVDVRAQLPSGAVGATSVDATTNVTFADGAIRVVVPAGATDPRAIAAEVARAVADAFDRRRHDALRGQRR